MQASAEAVELFQTLLNLEKPRDGKDAAGAMIAAARQSRWCRNQACASLVSSGAVACILDGGVRKFAVRPNGQRQIIDVVVTGDFLGFTPPDPAFALEAVANNTRIASFTREQIDALAARFPAISVLIKSCAADAIRRLEHHLLVQSRITARDKVGAYLAEMARRLKRSRTAAFVWLAPRPHCAKRSQPCRSPGSARDSTKISDSCRNWAREPSPTSGWESTWCWVSKLGSRPSF